MSELLKKEKSIITDYSKEEFAKLLKLLKSNEDLVSTKDVSHLELAYYEPSDEVVALCFYIPNKSSLIYSIKYESLTDCNFDVSLNKRSICFFLTCEMKENDDLDAFEDCSFTPYFNSWEEALKKLKLAKLNFTQGDKILTQKVIDVIKKEKRPIKINEILNN